MPRAAPEGRGARPGKFQPNRPRPNYPEIEQPTFPESEIRVTHDLEAGWVYLAEDGHIFCDETRTTTPFLRGKPLRAGLEVSPAAGNGGAAISDLDDD